MNKWLLNDNAGNPSLTRTCFALGFVVCTFKLLSSGMTFGAFTMGIFSGIDYGAALAALGGIYHLNKVLDSKIVSSEKEKAE